jgi:hypothetical protein
MVARTRLNVTLYVHCLYSSFSPCTFSCGVKQLFDLESEHRRFIFKIMTQFSLAVLRRLRETVRKKRPSLSGNMSGFFTTTTLPHKHGALGSEFLAGNRTPVVISGLLGF